jgi:hypothetical protein
VISRLGDIASFLEGILVLTSPLPTITENGKAHLAKLNYSDRLWEQKAILRFLAQLIKLV